MGRASANSEVSRRGETVLVASVVDEAMKLLEIDQAAARKRIAFAQTRVRSDDHPVRTRRLTPWQMRRVDAFIRDHLETRIRVPSIAGLVGLSPNYFSAAFKASKGIGCYDYIVRARVAVAKHLLLTTTMPISQIALRCGMADQSHLCRTFSRVVGTPPRAWQIAAQGGVRIGSGEAVAV
jgi:AraC family transcriptional regulator